MTWLLGRRQTARFLAAVVVVVAAAEAGIGRRRDQPLLGWEFLILRDRNRRLGFGGDRGVLLEQMRGRLSEFGRRFAFDCVREGKEV